MYKKVLKANFISICSIFISILSLKSQGACVDIWGVGTKLITSEDMPSLGGVYKLCAIEKDNTMIPVIKISDNVQKITNPGEKIVYRIFVDNMAEADLICLKDEVIDTTKPLTIFHPIETWKKTEFKNFTVKKLSEKIFENGKLIYQKPALKQICEFHKRQISGFWDEYKRLDKPHIFKVDLSQKLYDLKTRLLIEQPFLKSKNQL